MASENKQSFKYSIPEFQEREGIFETVLYFSNLRWVDNYSVVQEVKYLLRDPYPKNNLFSFEFCTAF